MRHMKLMKLMKLMLLFVLFVFLMSLFTSTFVSALQESDDNSDESTTVSSRQRRGRRCPFIRDSLINGWVRMRNRGRIAKFVCNNGYELVGNRVSTCIQGKWNTPLPVCASRGCSRLQISPPYSAIEIMKGTLLEVRCQTGFSFSGPFSSYRAYCNGSEWKILGSDTVLSKTETDRYLCKSTESHLITSEEISTISLLNTAVTAKSETTTNSKFNSKMPEMTAMFVSSVININAMSTESTSLFADNSKTPITEPRDKSYTSTNATNMIQEVSTLTTTTTIRFNSLEISSTETTPKMDFTTLSTELSANDTNYSIKSKQSSNNSTKNLDINLSPSTTTKELTAKEPIPLTSTIVNLKSTATPKISTTVPLTSSLLSSTPSLMKSFSLKSTSVPKTSTTVLSTSKLTAVPLSSTSSPTTVSLTSTSSPLKSWIPLFSTLMTSLTSKKVDQPLPALASSTEKISTMYTIDPKSTKMAQTEQLLTSKTIISSTSTILSEDSTKSMETKTNKISASQPPLPATTEPTKIKIKNATVPSVPTISSNGSNETTGPTKRIISKTTTSSTLLMKNSETIPEIRLTTALRPQRERSSVKASDKKMTTTPNDRHSLVLTTKQSLSSSSMDSMKYSLFEENTTFTPMRRRRQFSTKTRLVVTSIASESKQNNNERGLTISVTVISMTILVTILSLYLIKKHKNSQQNRLSDDSEMLYLSSNEVFQ